MDVRFSPARLSIVVSWTGSWGAVSPPVFPANGSPCRDASLPSAGSRRARFPGVRSTTKALRPPASLPCSLIGFARRYRATSCLRARRSAPARPEAPGGPGPWSPAVLPVPSRGRMRDLPGSLAIPPVPLPSSRTPVGPAPPGHQFGGAGAAPAARTAKAPAIRAISGLTTGLRHLLSTLQEHPLRMPRQDSLPAGWLTPLPRGSRTHWIASKGFRSLTWPSSFPGLTLALPRCARDDSMHHRLASKNPYSSSMARR